MSTPSTRYLLDISRRGLLRLTLTGGAVLVGACAASAAQAGGKVAQKTVNYQPQPRGKARCANCAQFVAPSDCKIVQGPVAADGWCSVYAPKP